MLLSQVGSGHELNYRNLNDRLSNSKINISNQALSEYFYKESSVELIKSIYEKVFLFQKEFFLKNYKTNMDQNILDLFHRILVEDSTICILNKNLKDKYKGSGGSASPSSLKIDVIHEIKTSTIVQLSISQGNVPDVCFSNLILEELQTNDLVLRDLGYFKLGRFNEISEKNAYFISRFKCDVAVYLQEDISNPIDLGRYLDRESKKFPNQVIDLAVHLGKEKQKSRLLAYKVPLEIANERRRKVRRLAACRREGISEGRLNLCDYVILITNIPQEMIRGEIIGTIYRIRWTIELMFKTWKSQLNLQLSLAKGHKVTRIECFVYASLIICLLTAIIHGWLKKAIVPMEKEISLEKLSKWLVNRYGYCKLLWGSVSKLEREIRKDIRKIQVQKRKRKTTLERVVFSETYSEKYVVNF